MMCIDVIVKGCVGGSNIKNYSKNKIIMEISVVRVSW